MEGLAEMAKFIKRKQRGDTLVEVILAMALLTAVLFTSWGGTNRATQLSLAARKRIDMVNLLKEQAEIIKAKQASKTDFSSLLHSTPSVGSPSSSSVPENPCDTIAPDGKNFSPTTSLPSSLFYFKQTTDAAGTVTIAPQPGPRVTDGDFVWVQYYHSSAPNNQYTDFYIRGCWLTTGGTQKLDNSQLIVRINDPS